jgi:formylglycine-generating enzyme required for sulfatase activity
MKNLFISLFLLSGIMAHIPAKSFDTLPTGKKNALEKSMVKINDSLYVGKYEVSNLDYREFINYLDKESEIYKSSVVDSMGWNRVLAFSDPYTEVYFRHPAFNGYPVVNISHQGAKNYCDWLTSIYHENEKRTFKEVKFRLPTQAEWEEIARSGFGETNKTDWPRLEDKKGRHQVNFRYISQQAIRTDQKTGEITVDTKWSNKGKGGQAYFITAPVESFAKDESGLFNIFGNVAEMVETEGISKGGHWWSTGYTLKIDETETYSEPSPFVGFRVIMEVIEE